MRRPFFERMVGPMVQKVIPGILALICLFGVAFAGIAQEAVLQADSLEYDPAQGTVRAKGNVTLDRDGIVLTAPHGKGTVEGREFHLWGKVRGTWKERGMELQADDVVFREGTEGLIVARGQASLSSGSDVLEAETLTWNLAGGDNYSASGDVRGRLGERRFQADSFEREGEKFVVREVRELVDPAIGSSLSAPLVEGALSGEELETMEASGGVTIHVDHSQNGPVKVTGQKALYSKARGTLVVSGKALAVQKDRTISADSIVFHVKSRRIEALGRPRLTFPLSGEDGK